MIVSHARRFVLFPDPLNGSDALMRGLAVFGDADAVADGPGKTDKPFFVGMSPLEAEWAFDGLGLAYKSYLRIAVVENPYTRMVRLFEMISKKDPLWVARQRAGLGRRDFASWLQSTKPDGLGAAGKHGPRWRRFGAWSARHWCGDHISHAIRQEAIEQDLQPILSALGIAPAFDAGFGRGLNEIQLQDYYDDRATALIQERYGWDLAQYGYGGKLKRTG